MKYGVLVNDFEHVVSHPTRGAWIEIMAYGNPKAFELVVPHTGCVD